MKEWKWKKCGCGAEFYTVRGARCERCKAYYWQQAQEGVPYWERRERWEMVLEPCKNCGEQIDRPYKGGRRPEYCLRDECVRERKNRTMRVLYYHETKRPHLARYAERK